MASDTLPTSDYAPSRSAGLAGLPINVSAALEALAGNWFRAGLTVLGVVIGVAAVIVLVAFGEGAQREITGQIDTLGATVAIVVPGKIQGQANFNPTGGMGISNLSLADAAKIRALPSVRAVAPITFITGAVFRGEKPASICMPLGTTPEYQSIRRLPLEQGRFFTDAELDQQVCVLGLGVKKDLFGSEDPLGKKITVNDQAYRVVGVVGERSMGSGLFGGDELNAIIYLPLKTVQRLTESKQIHRLFLEFRSNLNPDVVIGQVRQAMLLAHHNRDDFTLLRAKELLKMFYKIFTLLAALLLGITSISLIVGGIGIMNVMLVSVTERTREIGIRKTVGARRRDIFFQFLTEAVTLSAAGGILGIVLAIASCYFLARVLPLKPLISGHSVALGFGVCVAVGILSGVGPAVVAARKDPIEAIRHE